MHHYHAFGLKIASELALPELHPGSGPADVEIRYREGTSSRERDDDLPWIEGAGDDIRLRLGGIAFGVRGGRTVDIEAPLRTSSADVRIWLLGTVMAALLSQRNYLIIHANVILFGGRAAAFAAASGGGKSTLAAWFQGRGQTVLADDLCALRIGERAELFEGIPRLKLWAESLGISGRDATGLERVASGFDKYHVPLGRAREVGSLEPVALERLYVLDRAEEGEPFAIERLEGAAAAAAVMRNIFRWDIGQRIHGQPRAQFDQCLALARHAAMFRVKRRWGMEQFEPEAQAIAAHLAAPVSERPSPASPGRRSSPGA